MSPEECRQHAATIALDAVRNVPYATIRTYLEESGDEYNYADLGAIERMLETAGLSLSLTLSFPASGGDL